MRILTLERTVAEYFTGKGSGIERVELIITNPFVRLTGNKDVKQAKKISISKLRVWVRSKFL